MATSQAEPAPASGAAHLQAVEETSLQGKLVHRRFRPIYTNSAFAYLCGFERADDLMGRADILEFLDTDTRADPNRAWARMIHGPALYGRRTFYRRDGAAYPADIFARAILWEREPAVALAVVDVSEEENARKAVAAYKMRARREALAQQRFALRAARELGAPISTALTRLAALDGADLPAPARACVRDALLACHDLSRRITDLGVIAADAVRSEFTLGAALSAAHADMTAAADAAGVRLAPPSLNRNAVLHGDVRAVRRIASALLEAAICLRPAHGAALVAHSEAGGVSIRAVAEGAPASADWHDMARTPLAVARHLANAQGGSISPPRTAGGSWTASAHLPLTPYDEAACVRAPLRILAVEDNPRDREILHSVIGSLGHIATIVSGGEEALAQIGARSFDLVLLDLVMPVIDGFETARRIRAIGRPWANLPIAALTASCEARLIEAIDDAGMDALLHKPIDVSQLTRTLSALSPASIEAAEIHDIHDENEGEKSAQDQQRRHRNPIPRPQERPM
jgi:PAS domain S-box-containing protein